MVKLIDDVLVVFKVLLGFEVAEHGEEDLCGKHGVAAGLMHVALPDNAEELANSLKPSIKSDLVVDEGLDIKKLGEEMVYQNMEIVLLLW
jgi:hypothetical protein